MAAAVAYYAALSFFPLLLILISILGMVLQFTNWGQDAQHQVLVAVENYTSTAVRESVARMLDRVGDKASIGGPVGAVTLLIAAVAMFAHFERAFDRIWNVSTSAGGGVLGTIWNIVFHRLRAFLMLLAIAGLLLVNLISGLVFSGIRAYSDEFLTGLDGPWAALQLLSGLVINAFAFTLLYWLVPKVTVRFREALQGGVLAACIWELGRWVLASVLLSDKYGAYGVVGSFIAAMLWIYYGSAVIFFGAEYVQVICHDCDPQEGD